MEPKYKQKFCSGKKPLIIQEWFVQRKYSITWTLKKKLLLQTQNIYLHGNHPTYLPMFGERITFGA
jgi:hypothetical protein